MAGSSSPPSDPLFNSDPPYSALTPASSLRLPAARLVSFLSAGSGRIPANVNGPSGSPSGNPSGRIPANVNGPSGSPSGSPATNSECKMVAVRGLEVASFTVNGEELICLPQVFELFLKQLVGGLHTVYTKLKRLRITPVVCSVEQVRVLRSVGAIQPGVNRCKLISRADFRQLYTDCTTSSSRPGRPPKRALGVASMTDSSRLLPHGLLNPALLSQTGLTAAAMTEAVKLQKMRMMIGLHGNNDHQRQHNSTESESEELNSNTGGSECSWEKEQHLLSAPPVSSAVVGAPPGCVSGTAASVHLNTLQQHNHLLANRLSELPFMVMPHPLLPVTLPPASIAMAMNQMNQLSSFANMASVSSQEKMQTGNSVSKDNVPESPSPCPSPSDDDLCPRQPSTASSSSSSPTQAHNLDCEIAEQHIVKNIWKEKDEALLPLTLLKSTNEKMPLTSQSLSINHTSPAFTPFLLAEGLSSMETLLTNIQGLLKVAVENTRCLESRNQQEKKKLKEELERERDRRYTVERQLTSELNNRVSIQRRLRKERRTRRRLQEALGCEARRREHLPAALPDAVIPENEVENQQENSAEQENNRPYTKPPILF